MTRLSFKRYIWCKVYSSNNKYPWRKLWIPCQIFVRAAMKHINECLFSNNWSRRKDVTVPLRDAGWLTERICSGSSSSSLLHWDTQTHEIYSASRSEWRCWTIDSNKEKSSQRSRWCRGWFRGWWCECLCGARACLGCVLLRIHDAFQWNEKIFLLIFFHWNPLIFTFIRLL